MYHEVYTTNFYWTDQLLLKLLNKFGKKEKVLRIMVDVDFRTHCKPIFISENVLTIVN